MNGEYSEFPDRIRCLVQPIFELGAILLGSLAFSDVLHKTIAIDNLPVGSVDGI